MASDLAFSLHGLQSGVVRDIIESRRVRINKYGQLSKEGMSE